MTGNGKVLVTGGLVIDPSQNIDAMKDVLIEGGKVKALLPPSKGGKPVGVADGARVLDAKGRWVIPGVIDMHVHLREPGREADETLATGTRAAARGGVATVLAMPNTEPVIDSAAMVHFLRDRAASDGTVNVLVCGAVTRGQKGEELAEIGKMAEAGAVAASDDGHPVMNALVMRRALEYSKSIDIPILDHCEDSNLSCGGVMNEGPSCAMRGVRGVPAASEVVMAMRDITLAELTGGRLHLCHVSCSETVELVRRAKKRGVRVTAETAPHYFTLADSDIPGYDADFKMNPPLRTEEDVAAIRDGLADGTLDAVATDHAPHSPGKKALGFVGAPFGIIGLETLIPLALGLVDRKVITRKALVQRLSIGPARILGLRSKGALKPGMDGDVTVIDPGASYTVSDKFESKSRNSPFKGRKMKGRATALVVGGRVVLEEGRLL
ncbi:MAG: dihydroorotase [Proteobacteria bacterium]|nr:dihydroorotase [Pseudomonadota bacterium]